FPAIPILPPESLAAEGHGFVRELHLGGTAPPKGRNCLLRPGREQPFSRSSRADFAYLAFPIEPGKSGKRSFCIDTSTLSVCANNAGEKPSAENGKCKLKCDETY
ncbi:MAG: hypothetical protein L0312_00415, partial [Acidobacteria bacterium]|nr:hypothetical protein [Acidobacteriota bacterium]